MQRATALTLVMAATFLHGVTPARAAGAAEQREAAAVEVAGGHRQRWDCVAFTTWTGIYVVNLDGTGLTRLTTDYALYHSPAFSPDGTKIAYVKEDKDTDPCAVYVMNVDGTDKRRLSPPNDVLEGYGACGDFDPVFAPDGERVAATRVYIVKGPLESEIIFFPTSGGPEKNSYGAEPRFTADGRRMALRDTAGGCLAYPLCIANADGSGAPLRIGGPVYSGELFPSYALSPDCEKVVYEAWEKDSEFHIYVINADGTGRGQLTKGDERPDEPAFSPDGKKIIYLSSVRRGLFDVSDIYIINADGSERRALTRTPVDEHSACFTPDGSKIVFVAWPLAEDDSAETGVYVMNADGSGRRFLAAGRGFSLGPSLVEGRLVDSYGNWHDVDDDAETKTPGE